MNDVRESLSRLWLEALSGSVKEQVEDHDRFFACGGDSVGAIGLLTEVEEELAVKIDPAEFMGALAEGDFSDLVKLAGATE